ncbi:hypothetical protein ACFORG_08510 [Lutimaribacter marinistellae]|uniref:Ca2+-binding protein, RTX toxin-related n=1 Tax=Lutimaribacter marinistellae TaxID=1820329 RepID=A0ABV7TFK6_9RHOB
MPTPTVWKAQTTLSLTGSQSDPHVIGLANGQILVAFSDDTIGVGADIVGRIYDIDGTLVRDTFVINTRETTLTQWDFDIAAMGGDEFAIAYISEDGLPRSAVIWERQSAGGTVIATQQVAVENSAADLQNAKVVYDRLTQQSLVSWERYDGGTDINVRAATLSAAGVIQPGSSYAAAQNSADPDADHDSALLATGELVTATAEVDGANVSIEVHVMDPGGAQSHSNIGFATASPDLADPKVAALKDGTFVVIWEDDGDIVGQRFNDDASVNGAGFNIVAGTDVTRTADIVALPTGGFFVIWRDDSDSRIEGRVFNSDGTSDGSQVTVFDYPGMNPYVGVTADGRILATVDRTGASTEIAWAILDPRGDTIDATDMASGPVSQLVTNTITTRIGDTTLDGTPDADTLLGQGGDDTIRGLDGDDVIKGGTGSDLLRGGYGNDTIETGSGLNTVFANQNDDSVIGGSGADYIHTGWGDDYAIGQGGGDTLIGSLGNDTLLGQGWHDSILGGDGEDSLLGDDGDDTISGGEDDDYIHGGSDGGINDTATWAYSAPTGSILLLNRGWNIDLRSNSATFSVNGGVALETDTVFEIEHVIGSGYDDTITGNDRGNQLEGGLGNDVLIDDASGADTLIGGAGIDTAVFTPFFSSGSVFDMVLGQRTFNGTKFDEFSEIENLVFNGNVTVIGDGENNHLSAYIPTDARHSNVSGGGGDDTIDAGAGNDTVSGGSGNDLIIDRLEIGSNSTLSGNGQTDTLDLSEAGTGFTYVSGGPLTGNNSVELDISGFEHIIGTDFADTIEELAGIDTIDAGGGNDTVIGNPASVVDKFDGGDGIDRFELGQTSASYLVKMDTGEFGGFADVLTGFEYVVMSDGDDTVRGVNGQDDSIEGGGGNDSLRGLSGDDYLVGGAGNDTLIGNGGDNTLIGGSGIDTAVFFNPLTSFTFDPETAAAVTLNFSTTSHYVAGDVEFLQFSDRTIERDLFSYALNGLTLERGVTYSNQFGNYLPGSIRHGDNKAVVYFDSNGYDQTISFKGYDIDAVGEIEAMLNGKSLGFLSLGGNGAFADYSLTLSAADMAEGLNAISFHQRIDPAYEWGITDLRLDTIVDAALTRGVIDDGDYGNNFNGTSDADGIVLVSYDGSGPVEQLELTGFDVDFADEVEVRLNGLFRGYLPVTGNGGTGPAVFELDTDDHETGENLVEIIQARNPSFDWGVTDLRVGVDADFRLEPGVLESGEYGNDFNGATATRGLVTGAFQASQSDLILDVSGYDIDTSIEVQVSLDQYETVNNRLIDTNRVLGTLMPTANNAEGASQFGIDARWLIPEENVLRFAQMTDNSFRWGVTDLLLRLTDTRLTVGNTETASFGNGFNGTSDADGMVFATFTGLGADLTLDFDGFDFDLADEVELLLNGRSLGFAGLGPNNGTQGYQFSIDAVDQVTGLNVLTFAQRIDPGFDWGVTNLALALAETPDTALTLGTQETGEYGNDYNGATDPDGRVLMTFHPGSAERLVLDVSGYDADFSGEIAVLVNGVERAILDGGANNGETPFVIGLDDDTLAEGVNTLIFEQRLDPNFRWGVTDILLEEPNAHLGFGGRDDTDYGNGFNGTSEPDGELIFTFDSDDASSFNLEIAAFDVDTASEIEIRLNGDTLGFLEAGANNGISQHELSFNSAQTVDGLNVLSIIQAQDTSFTWGISSIELIFAGAE